MKNLNKLVEATTETIEDHFTSFCSFCIHWII